MNANNDSETHDPSSASSVQPEDSISVGEAIDKQISDSLIERASSRTTARSRRLSVA